MPSPRKRAPKPVEQAALPPFDLLKVDQLHASYDGLIEVLHGVAIEVREHEIVTILGSNGAGKTTLVAAILGLVPHVRGSVRFQGEELTNLPPHAIVARGVVEVPTGREVFPDQTVTENLLLGAHTYRKDRARVRRNLADMTQRFPVLGQRRDQLAGTLSGGEQQMLAIGRALMARPKIMLLDEPSMGLAPVIVQEVFRTIRRLKAEGMTMLLVEQFASAALGVADHVYVMERGRVAVSGTPDDLRRDPRVLAAYLG